MEVCMSLKSPAIVRIPSTIPNNFSRTAINDSQLLLRHSLSSYGNRNQKRLQQLTRPWKLMVVEAKGKKGMQAKQFERQMPTLPKIEDDGNPKFVIFIRMANVDLWFPVSIVGGGTTAKIMVAAKDNFLGKYIYKDTLSRNLAAVVYKDEKEMQETAKKQHRLLLSAKEFRYGFKIVEGTDIRAALTTTDVIELPTRAELRTVLDRVKDFFGEAKKSFRKLTNSKNFFGEAKKSLGQLTAISSTANAESEESSSEKPKVKS